MFKNLRFRKVLTASLTDTPQLDYGIGLKLFAQVNNDAWLKNSLLEGGQIANTASLLSATLNIMQMNEPHETSLPTDDLQTLQRMLHQIITQENAIQNVFSEGKVQIDEHREKLLQNLAGAFSKQIMALEPNTSFYMPGGFYGHVILFEFKRVDDKLLFMVYNTGGGLEYHESKMFIDHGIVKQKYLPVHAYQLPFNNVFLPEFTNYINELLKASIASEWRASYSKTTPFAYPRTAENLYQEILPLIVHIEGIVIDPKPNCNHPKFITGQRSGKCTEAVFHPLLREIFADERLYQRFMLAYRKLTIANFIMSADLNDPIVLRQIKLAVTHLAARSYKHSNLLMSDEISAVTSFSKEALDKIGPNLMLQNQVHPTQIPLEISTLKPSSMQLNSLLQSKQPLTAIILLASSAMPTLASTPLQPCNTNATDVSTLKELLEKMTQVEQWSALASTHSELSSKEIVVAIEELFFTYPIAILHHLCSDAEHKMLASSIQSLLSIYFKNYLEQFGVDKAPTQPICLTARHIVTVYSALALLTTVTNEPSLFYCATRALFAKHISETIEKNALNPYLASMSYACDQRLAALSTLKAIFVTTDTKKLIDKEQKYLYAAVITADKEQKSILLDIFRTQVLPCPRKFNLDYNDAAFLCNEDEECLFVLFNAYSKLSPETKQQLSTSMSTAQRMVYYHQLFNFGCLLISRSERIPQTSRDFFEPENLMKTVQFKPNKVSEFNINWVLDTQFYIKNTISHDLWAAHNPIQNNDLSRFLNYDMNRHLANEFSNSLIQTEASASRSYLTQKEFLLSQFCHTRTADSCQITATLEFFQANSNLLQEPDWQTVATLNFFQPTILLKAFERTPDLQEKCELFLTKLLIINTDNRLPNKIGLFCIHLQSLINAYLVDSPLPMHKQAIISLKKSYTILEEMLQQNPERSLKMKLYQIQSHVITHLLKHTHKETQQQLLLTSYLTAKLLGTSLGVLHLKTDPNDFVQQEIDKVLMKAFLVKHANWVKKTSLTLLKHLKLSCKQDGPAPQLQYPNLFVALADGVSAAINLETGQILKNGKEYCFLPSDLLASHTFRLLAGDTAMMGWVAMKKGTSVVNLFEITSPALFIEKTIDGFIFQRDCSMPNGRSMRCQLTPAADIKTLHNILPKTLLDAQHRFWVSIEGPKQLLIEDNKTKTMLYHMAPSPINTNTNTNTNTYDVITAMEDHYKLLQQSDVEKYNISALLGHFEDPQFISVETYTGNDPTKPKARISFDRYGLKFVVTSTSPLIIESLDKIKGTLLSCADTQQKTGLQNLLLIQTEKNVVALLPRQYFIHDTKADKQRFEYTPLCLDTKNKHVSFTFDPKNTEPVTYCNQSEWISVQVCSQVDNATAQQNQYAYILQPSDGAGALYLAYTYLANFNPYAALDSLKYCEQQGGLKGTQRELEHLMLFFTGMPAQVEQREPVDIKKVNNPEFIAVRTFALYLYADKQHHYRQSLVEDTTQQDALCFTKDTSAFQQNLESTVITLLTQYFTSKHNIPISMQLNTQQEAACLRLKPKDSVLGLTYKHQLVQTFNQPDTDVTLEDGCTYNETKSSTIHSLTSNSSDIERLLMIIDKSTRSEDGAPLTYNSKTFTMNEKISAAIAQLHLGVHPYIFFKHFLTYFYIAQASQTDYPTEKDKLKTFLTHKMHILSLGGIVPGADLLGALYSILMKPCTISDNDFLDIQSHYRSLNFQFNKNKFHECMLTILKNTSVNFTITDDCLSKEKNLPLSQLLASEESPLINHLPNDQVLLTYPADRKSLANSGLFSLEELATTIGKQFSEKLKAFKELVSSNETRKLNKKSLISSELSSQSFIDAAKTTLQAERELGKQHHDDIQSEINLANQLFNDPQQRIQLLELVARTEVKAQATSNHLRLHMLEFVTACTLPTLDNPITLGKTAKFKKEIDEALLVNLYLQCSAQAFMEMIGLDKDQAQTLYVLIADYLFISTYQQQLQKINQTLQLQLESGLEKDFALRSLALQLITPNSVSLSTDPTALTVFQFAHQELLRPEQVTYLRAQLTSTNGHFNNNLCQLIMGFGKTFLLPILAKAKANGDNLSVIEVPEALLATNLANFTQASLKIFNQKPNEFYFDRHTNSSSQALLSLFEGLLCIQKNRDYLVTTGESVASLLLRYIEISSQLAERQKTTEHFHEEKPATSLIELQKQAHWLGELVKLFKYKADTIVDEVHAGLNIRKKLIYSIGEKPLEQEEINSVLNLYQFILPLTGYQNLTVHDIIQNPSQIPPSQWQTIIEKLTHELLHHEKSPIQMILKKIPVKNQPLLSQYLKNKVKPEEQTSILEQLSSLLITEQDVLALYKAELTTLLPATLSKQNRRHFGLLLDESQIMHAPCAVPFIASDTPNIISTDGDKVKTTHFANPDETLNYTIQAYLVQGLPKAMVKKIIISLREKAKLEFIRDNSVNYATTETGLMIEPILQNARKQLETAQEITLDNSHLEDNNAVTECLMRSSPFIFYALEHEILPTIMIENATLEINSTQRAYLYRSIQGISGTIDNYRSISQRLHLDSTQAIGTNGVTIGLIDKKSTVHVFTDKNQSLVQTFFSKESEGTLLHAIIDAGGLFTGVSNFEVAQEISKQLSAKPSSDPRKFVLFLNNQNELSAIDINKPGQLIYIGATDEKTIRNKLGKQIKTINWVTYFDQRHTVGMDIPQAQRATAAITVAYDGTLSLFLQAAMRMRGLPKEQTLQIFMDQSVANYCTTTIMPPTPEDVIDFLSNNETTSLSEDHFRYILSEMDNTLYQELLTHLLPDSNTKEPSAHALIIDRDTAVNHQAQMLGIIQKHADIFIKTSVMGLFNRYGHLEKEGPLDNLLNSKKQHLQTLRTQILSDLNLEQKITHEQFEKTLDSLITLAQQTCKPIVVSRNLCEEGNQVETETETKTETALNAQMETEAELEIVAINQDAFKEPTVFKEWLSKALEQRNHTLSWETTCQQHCLSIPAMLNTARLSPPQLTSNIWISINHAKMSEEQTNLFDYSKMPFKYLLISWQAGKLTGIVITPKEVDALLNNKTNVFSTSSHAAQWWIESIPNGYLVIGNKPEKITTDLNYLALKEQLLFINGDIRSLLFQKHYVWLSRQLEQKKDLLPTLLMSRPDQREYVSSLINRLHAQVHLEENAALDNLVNSEAKRNRRNVFMFKLEDTKAQTQQCIAACILIARFNVSDKITSDSLSRLYPQLTTEQTSHLEKLYTLKKILRQKISSKPTAQEQRQSLLATLQTVPIDLLRNVMTQAVIENDEHLIHACYQAHISQKTAILDTFPIDDNHPILFTLNHQNFLLCATIIQLHFKETSANYRAPWIEKAFEIIYGKNELITMKILLENSGPRLELSPSLASDCIVLFAQFNEPHLTELLIEKMKETPSIKILVDLNKTCQALVKDMTDVSKKTLTNDNYLMQYPNFSLRTGRAQGYSQLMLACETGNYAITRKLFPLTSHDNRAQETKGYQSAFTLALKSDNKELLVYLIQEDTVNFYNQLSPVNTCHLILNLFNNRLDDELLCQVLKHLLQYCHSNILLNTNLADHTLYFNLVSNNKLKSAGVLDDYLKLNHFVFKNEVCLNIMLKYLRNKKETSFLFLLNRFTPCIMEPIILETSYRDRPEIAFVKGYDTPELRRAYLSALQACKPRPSLYSNTYQAIGHVIIGSLQTNDPEQFIENLKDAQTISEVFNDKQLNTFMLLTIFRMQLLLSLDFLQLLTTHCELNGLSPLLIEFLEYVTFILKGPQAGNWLSHESQLTDLICSCIPTDASSKKKALTYCKNDISSLSYLIHYMEQVPAAFDKLFPLIQEYSQLLSELAAFLPPDKFNNRCWILFIGPNQDKLSDEAFNQFIKLTYWKKILETEATPNSSNDLLSGLFNFPLTRFKICWDQIKSYYALNSDKLYNLLLAKLSRPHGLFKTLTIALISVQAFLSPEQKNNLFKAAIRHQDSSEDYINFLKNLADLTDVATFTQIIQVQNNRLIEHILWNIAPDLRQKIDAQLTAHLELKDDPSKSEPLLTLLRSCLRSMSALMIERLFRAINTPQSLIFKKIAKQAIDETKLSLSHQITQMTLQSATNSSQCYKRRIKKFNQQLELLNNLACLKPFLIDKLPSTKKTSQPPTHTRNLVPRSMFNSNNHHADVKKPATQDESTDPTQSANKQPKNT